MHHKIKQLYLSAICNITSNLDKYVTHPGRDLSRNKKLPADKLIKYLVSQGSSSTRNELLDFFNMDTNTPSVSALCQQRAKLKPEALEALFHNVNSSVLELDSARKGYRFFAVDGSNISFCSKPSLSAPEYFILQGHEPKGLYSMHLTVFYDMDKNTYTNAVIQPYCNKDEYTAFCEMLATHSFQSDTKDVFICDRGFCSYNTMAHVIEKEQYFLFRTKDIHSKGLTRGFKLPDEKTFDVTVSVTLTRCHSLKKLPPLSGNVRFVAKATRFDFIEYGTGETYEMSFRVVRFPVSENECECIVTNLPEDAFPLERIKELYSKRWAVESSFRQLKYTIGLNNFHACKAEYVKQEVWARLIAYNITEIIMNHTTIKCGKTKHKYKVNFSTAAHICRVFLRTDPKKNPVNVIQLLQQELIPIRNNRHYFRGDTTRTLSRHHFTYRAS